MSNVKNVEVFGPAVKFTYDDGHLRYCWPEGKIEVTGNAITISYPITNTGIPIVTKCEYGLITDQFDTANAQELVEYWLDNGFF